MTNKAPPKSMPVTRNQSQVTAASRLCECRSLYTRETPVPRTASWYSKPVPTFSDALARVRRELWTHHDFRTSAAVPDLVKLPRTAINALIGAACYAA